MCPRHEASVIPPLSLRHRHRAALLEPPPAGVVFPKGEIVDLSHTYDSQTIYWPTAEGFQLRRDADGVTPAGYYYAANSFFTSEHGGTHIDAPVHFAEGHPTVDKIPVDRLIGRPSSSTSAQQSAGRCRLPGDDCRFPALRAGARRDPDGCDRSASNRLFNPVAGGGAIPRHHAAGRRRRAQSAFSRAASRRGALDRRQPADSRHRNRHGEHRLRTSTLFESHRALYERDIPAFENLTALDRLPVTGAYIIALPMKIGGGAGRRCAHAIFHTDPTQPKVRIV